MTHRSALRLLALLLTLALAACALPAAPAAPTAAPPATDAPEPPVTDAPATDAPAPAATPEPAATSAPPALLPAPLYILDQAGQLQRLAHDGTTLVPLAPAPAAITAFDVSPVTGAVAYVSANTLYVAGPDGEDARALFAGPALASGGPRLRTVHFSPGGQRLAFALDGVYVIPASGGSPALVQPDDPAGSPGAGTYFPVAWAPDGSRLLIHRAFYTTSGTLQVNSIGFDSITSLGGACCEPSWAQDDRYIYVSGPYYGMRVEPGLRRFDLYSTGPAEVLVAGVDPATDHLRLFHFARMLADGKLYSFRREISKADYSAVNMLPAFTMTRSAADGVTALETLRADSHPLLEVLWAEDGSGAAVITQPGDGSLTPVLWLASSDRPAQALPISVPADSERRLRWGATAEALDLLALRAQFLADTGVTLAPEGTYDAFTGVGVAALSGDAAGLWAVYTVGMRDYLSPVDQPHLLALYARDPAGWRQAGLQEVGANEAAGDPGADYIGEGSVTQVQVAPGRLWLQVDAGVGAHSGAYHLYSFDAAGFTLQATGFSSSPGAGRVEDLTGDGIGEVLLDASDYYVFCYACGVRYAHTTVLRWDGAALVPVALALLPDTAPAALVDLNNRAVQQAQAGLWRDALDTVALLLAQAPLDASGTAAWNATLITLNANEKAPGEFDPFPVLSQLFYGDYAAAVAPLRAYTAAQLFAWPSQPLVDQEMAQGWEESIRQWVFNLSDAALASGLMPDETLAAAHFLRAWAAHVVDPTDPAVQENLARSIALAPADPLYTAAAALY